jgi:signal transduction histidine kinase
MENAETARVRPIVLALASRIQAVLAARSLQALGHRVLTFGDGLAALRAVYTEAPGAVVLDRHLPLLAGDQVCRLLKADPAVAALPVILCGGGEPAEHESCRQRSGADCVVSNGDGVEALAGAVTAVLPVAPDLAPGAPPAADDLLARLGALMAEAMESAPPAQPAPPSRAAVAPAPGGDATWHHTLGLLGHQLRTPLNGIIGYSDVILGPSGAEAPRGAAAVRDEAVRLASEVAALLGEAGAAPPDGDGFAAFAASLPARLGPLLVSLEASVADAAPDAAWSSEQDAIRDEVQRLRQFVDQPARLLATAVAGRPNVAATDAVAPGDCPPASLLVVDDLAVNRNVLSRQLTALGHRVATAESGAQALAMCATLEHELVLLDLMMPDMNGDEVLAALKADPALRGIPVIMISALDELDSVVRCIALGADDYLPKPVNSVLLNARLHSSLDRKWRQDAERDLHRQLQASYEQLQALVKLKEDLTHMIVHDLRTPLTSILTGLMTMESLGGLDELQMELLGGAMQGSQTLLGMINDLLDISKMEDGSMVLDREPTDAAAVIAAALQQVANLAAGEGLTLHSAVETGLPPVLADSDKIRRTVVNLLGNAIKFTPEGGQVTVACRRASNAPELVFSVTDTGRGIPREAFERIFEKFGQVSAKGQPKMSTGLGLTFCKMAVEAHGGRIWVESEMGAGSTFAFTLPLGGG